MQWIITHLSSCFCSKFKCEVKPMRQQSLKYVRLLIFGYLCASIAFVFDQNSFPWWNIFSWIEIILSNALDLLNFGAKRRSKKQSRTFYCEQFHKCKMNESKILFIIDWKRIHNLWMISLAWLHFSVRLMQSAELVSCIFPFCLC